MPRRKPAAVRSNRETVDVGAIADLAAVVAEPPPAPPGLTRVVREGWLEFWSSPLARLVHTSSDMLALRRLFLFYDEQERGIRAFRRRRVVPGSTGQLRLNPALKAVAPSDILALEDRFGLSPWARLHLGVVLGDAARSLRDIAEDAARDSDDDAPDPRLVAMEWQPG